jgi:hypothetical protein
MYPFWDGSMGIDSLITNGFRLIRYFGMRPHAHASLLAISGRVYRSPLKLYDYFLRDIGQYT